MVSLLSITHFILYAFHFFILARSCLGHGTNDYQLSSVSALSYFDNAVTRVGFDNSSVTEDPVVLLQDDGIADIIKTFFFILPPSVTNNNVTFVQMSSNSNILNASETSNILVSSSAPGALNVTTTLTFDGLVGVVQYTLLAIQSETEEEISRITISFLIAGMTFYRESPSGAIEIVSGEGNEWSISYQQAMSSSLSWQTNIKVFIQYANGSTSTTISGSEIPNGDSLQTMVVGESGLFIHNTSTCQLDVIGTQSTLGTPLLPSGCGCGFYYAFGNYLSFAVLFQAYRVGYFTIRFSWVGITAGSAALSAEALEISLNVNVTGTPPLAVIGIDPITGLLRSEGGEIRTLRLVNVELHQAVSFEIRVDGVDTAFKMVPGTFEAAAAPNYVDFVSFLTEPGSGVDLSWSLYYQTLNGSASELYNKAVFLPSFVHLFSYDTAGPRIDSLDPRFGSEEGGETLTLTGYFPSFMVEYDSINFSGYKLSRRYIISVSQRYIVFIVPSRIILGWSYEYRVSVSIGFSYSNYVIYSYYLTRAGTFFRFTGLSEVTPGSYRLGNCSYAQFTVMIAPLTSQIENYQWSLHREGDTGNDLMQTTPFQSVNASAQTITLYSEMMALGVYTLRVQTTLMKLVTESEITLIREHVLVIGVTLLPIGNQTLSSLTSPLRATAVVQYPECYLGNGTLMFEWDAFGDVQQYSSENSSVVSAGGPFGANVTRLGWEYTVARENVTIGSHDISFRAWIKGEEMIYGQASTQVHVGEGSLVAVIRSGERNVTANHLSVLTLYGNYSYDSNILDERRYANLTYEWQCRQSESLNFSVNASSRCISALIPDPTSTEFLVPIDVVESELNVRYLQYSLIVRKGDRRTSETQTLVVEIQDYGSMPSLDGYNISITNAEGMLLDWSRISYYEDIIIQVQSSLNSTWSYELVEPASLSFFASANLINGASFYSPSASIYGSYDNYLPLGIRANALSPSTTYVFRILFYTNSMHVSTNATFAITTMHSEVVHLSSPSYTEATTMTNFTLTAGVASFSTHYSYYFTVTDSSGYEYCAGGCTGHEITYFQMTRTESYTMSTYLCDAQGKVITSDSSSSKVTVTESNTTVVETEYQEFKEYHNTLDGLYDYGNDQQWVMVAQEISITMIGTNSYNASSNATSQKVQDGLARERQLATHMDSAMKIARGATELFCNSYPNTFYSQDCIKLVDRISQLRLLDIDTVYFLMQTATCCIRNTPERTLLSVIQWLPDFISQLNRLTRNLNQGGNSRRRLLQSSGMPANPVADVQLWTGEVMAYAAASGKVDGFSDQYLVGDKDVVGHVSVAVASKSTDLSADTVNGIQRNIVRGPSGNELFYPRGSCYEKLFTTTSSKRRILVLHTTDNFILLGFQDPPLRSNLVDRLYWMQVYEMGAFGLMEELNVRQDGFCYCWRLPVVRLQEELESSVDDMPGLFGVTDLKTFRQDVETKGEAFNYEYENSKTSEYNTTEGWVEGCRIDVGLVSTTVVSKRDANILSEDSTIIGFAAWAIVGLVVGGLILVMIAVISSWLVAAQAVSDGAFGGDGEVYVERDVYGRGTGLEGNVTRVRSRE